MADVHLQHLDYSQIRIISKEPSIMRELADHFTYFADNYKFHPKFRARMWDGKIRLLRADNGIIYAGLAQKIKKFCDANRYSLTFDDELCYENISKHEVEQFIEKLNPPEWLDTRDYQIDSIVKCIRSNRRTLISPTASGKSFMIYVLTQWYKKKTLLIVPRIGLVAQMRDDLISYGFDGVISTSTDGGIDKSNDIDADIVITTWQSLDNGKTRLPKKWYNQFDVVFGDEAHGAKAKSLINILTKLTECKYRFGTTGTLDNQTLNEATIQGLFGPIFKSVSTKELMYMGYVAKLQIKAVVLNYEDEFCKEAKGMKYHDEIEYIVSCPERNKFLKNLTLSLDDNKLLFFHRRKHGEALKDMITAESENNVFYIVGGIDAEVRNSIRYAMEKEHNATLIASLGTTSTGISINKLKHMIFGHPSKSMIQVLQSIGRLLRLHSDIETVYLYDIVDNLTYGSKQNYTLKHFEARCKIYDDEKFDYKIYNVKIRKARND